MIKAKAKISIGQGIPGRDIELRNNITHIQWKYKDEDETKWKDLISLEELQASEIELQVNDTHIQWRYDFEETWKDLISLEEITPSIIHLESSIKEKIEEINNLKNELEESESSRNETFTQKVNEVDTAISNANKVTQDTEEKLVEITNEYSELKDDIVKTNEDIKLAEQQRQQAETDRENTFRETIENANSKIQDLTTLEDLIEEEEIKRQQSEITRQEEFNNTIEEANIKIYDLTSLENYVKEEEIKRQEAEINRANNFNESIKNTNNKIKEADDKIVDVEERMKHIEDNFNGLVDGEGIVTKEYLEKSYYDKDEINKQMESKSDSNHTHNYLELDKNNRDGIYSGNDNATSKDANIQIKSWQGVGFVNTCNTQGNVPVGENATWINTRWGNLYTRGELYANTDKKVYHEGNKPTPSDIGASTKDHTHLGFIGSRQPLEIQEWIDFHFLNSQKDYDGRLYLSLDGFRVNSPNGNGKIYHEGFKPNPFDIGAMADYYLGGTPTKAETSNYLNRAGVFRCSGWMDIDEINSTDNQATILSLPYNSGWKTQIAINPHTGQMFVRHINNNSIQFNWTKIAYTSTFSLFQEVEKELTEMELGIYQNNEIKTLNLSLEEEKSPFDDQFKTKWWKIYKELRIKEHIQRLYNLNLITKDDYIKIVKEEPKEKYQPNNVFTKLRQDILNQDLQLLEQDLRLISIENTFNKDVNTFNISVLNNNSYNLLLRIIENKNYKDKSEIINIIEFYHQNSKISNDNKNNLIKLINSK